MSSDRRELSPLRILTDVIKSLPFTKEEVIALFAQYSNARGRNIDPRIVTDIYEMTGGYLLLLVLLVVCLPLVGKLA